MSALDDRAQHRRHALSEYLLDTDRDAAVRRFHDALVERLGPEQMLEIAGVVVNMASRPRSSM
jgi:hypothetical protein